MSFTITAVAEKFIRRMLRFDAAGSSSVRPSVTAGSCSGPAALFDVGATPRCGDAVVEHNGRSRLLLKGAIVDFVETVTENGFAIRDPKTANCGCTSAPAVVALAHSIAH